MVQCQFELVKTSCLMRKVLGHDPSLGQLKCQSGLFSAPRGGLTQHISTGWCQSNLVTSGIPMGFP